MSTSPARSRTVVTAWALWDWGSAAFNAVIVTFVFAPYLTSGVAGDPDFGAAALGWATAVSGLLVAVLAPAAGVRADAKGTHRRALASYTMVVVGLMLAMFLIRDEPQYFVPGLILLGLGQLIFELAEVSYNGMLTRISGESNAGTISSIGWAMGYIGGLALLFLMLFAFIQPEVGLFGAGDDGGLRYRWVALCAGVWFLIFALPIIVLGPAGHAAGTAQAQAAPSQGFFASWRADYARVFHRLRILFLNDRSTFLFFIASAVFRDGLATIFAMAGVLAKGAYAFSGSEVIYLGVAANLVAGIGCLIAGRIDDKLGPKAVIITGLICLITGTLPILVSDDKTVFWIAAMWLCLFVGPVQASSRSFLSRITPPERAGENFGLYATTGRAVSFLGPSLFAAAVTIFGFQRAGALGIVLVLAAGLALMLCVPRAHAVARAEAPEAAG